MNLRISNLSYQRNMQIVATGSANPFDGTDLTTTTDAMLSLIPKSGRKIEGTLQLASNDFLVTLATDLKGENVIVKSTAQADLVVPLHQNIAIEWDGGITEIVSY